MAFSPQWIVYIPAMYIAIFLLLIFIKTLFKNKIKNIEQISSVSGASVGILGTIIQICLACAVPVLGFFGFLFQFPPVIVALLLGSSIYSLSDITSKYIEAKNKAFPMHVFVLSTLFMVIGVGILYMLYGNSNENPAVINHGSGGIHIHADMKIYLDETEYNIYTKENIERNPYVHFHLGKNQQNVIHIEGENGVYESSITLYDFLKTLNIDMYRICEGKYFYYYINGREIQQPIEKYVIQDLDKLLIKCGDNAPTAAQVASVGSFSCIQSGRC